MSKVRGGRVRFDPERIIMSGGATGANELIIFCLADPGDAFLVPSPYYPAYVPSLLSFFIYSLNSMYEHYFTRMHHPLASYIIKSLKMDTNQSYHIL